MKPMGIGTFWASHPRLAAGIALALGLALTAVAVRWQLDANARTADARFDELAQVPVAQLAERMRSYEYALLGARSTVLADDPKVMTRGRYQRASVSRDIEREFPGARTIAVIWRVHAADEQAFVAAARADGAPGFAIRQPTPHDGDRYVLTYAAPMTLRPGALGMDFASEPSRRQALETAMRRGVATISAPVALFDATGPGQQDFLLSLPIYRPGAATATEAERVAATLGWMAAPLQIEKLFASLRLDDSRLGLSLDDLGDNQGVFFRTAGGAEAAAGGLVRRVDLPIYGRAWTVEIRARPRFLEGLGLPDPRGTAAFGGLLAVLSSCLVWMLAQGAQRTQRLRTEQARSAAIVSNSSDAIIGETLDGIVTDWNAGAEKLFGYRAEELLGHHLPRVLNPDGFDLEPQELSLAMSSGQVIAPFDTTRLHRDGSRIDVSAAAAPIEDDDGEVIGFAETIRDIRTAKRDERETRKLNVALERRVAERTALLDSARHQLQTIMDAMPSTIAYWDRQGLNRFANRVHRDWYGIDPEDARGKSIKAVLGDETYESNRPHIEAALRGEPQTFERTVPRRDRAGERHVLVHYRPDIVDGRVEGFYAFVNDVSELVESRQQLAAAQRESQALLNTMNLHTIVSVADRGGSIIDANESFCRISGYTREELLGQNHRTINSGHQTPEFWVDMWATISAGRPWRGDIRNRAKDGSFYWVDSIIAPFAAADGSIEKYISIRLDITAAKRAEQELRASKAFLDRAGEIAGVGGWELDLRTHALTWSAETFRIHDLPVDGAPDLASALDFYDPEARAIAEQAVARAAADGIPFDLELPLVTAKGRALWVRSQGKADLEDGRAIRLVGAFQDITERKKADALLKEANDRFAIAADSADIGVWEWDVATDVLAWDDRMYRLYGRPRSGFVELYSLWATSLHPADRAHAEAALQSALGDEADYDIEFRIVWPTGEERHLRANGRVIRDPAGVPLRMTGVNIDITERKRAEADLIATASLLKTVLASASEVSIIASDPQHNITVFNAGAQRMLGYRAEDVIGRATPLLIHNAEEVELRSLELSAELGRAVEGVAVLTEPSTLGTPRVWTYVRRDGTQLQVSLVMTEMQAADGSCLGFLGVAHDVTVRKEQEASLRMAMYRAKHASEAKSQFLANMSHEIRTPMNAVIGLTYLLAQSALDSEQIELIDKLHFATKSLLRVIDDVLDLSKIEAGELKLESMPFALHPLLHELGGMMSVEVHAKRIRFAIDIAPGLPNTMVGDATRLGQVLTNLLANAIKFTDRGHVTLGVRALARGTESIRLSFDVADSGIGIAPEVQARLFAPFVQADVSTKRRFGGTGLGLSIVKRVVTAMGGTITLVSAPGQGSTFSVELEFPIADDESLSRPLELEWSHGRMLQGLRVLVTDDSEVNLEVARRILEHEGAEIALARNGLEAVEALRKQPGAFDVVLMDVQMPVLDGYEATQCIRGELGLTRLPVIALTAGAMTDEHQRAGVAGMDAVVTKPFDTRSLVRTLLRHARPSAPMRSESQSADDVPGDATDWPRIEGIDTDDVRRRLGGDLDLFRSMLGRLLGEFGDLAPDPAVAAADVDTQAAAARLHKLTGSAGMLGAKAISELSSRAETAARSGDVVRLRQWLHKLVLKIERLRTCSEGLREPPEDPDSQSAPDLQAEVDGYRLKELLLLLSQERLGAIDCFNALAPQLRQRMGRDDYRHAREYVESLQFPMAAELLSTI